MAAVYYYPSTAIRVCVDEINGTRVSGRAYCAQLEDVFNFSDMDELVLGMEDMFDERGYPDAFQVKRSFVKKPEDTLSLEEKLLKQAEMRAKSNIPQSMGKLATFLVYVMSRRNSSWQGRIEWIDEGGITSFNSALDFLRLVDAKIVRGEVVKDETLS